MRYVLLVALIACESRTPLPSGVVSFNHSTHQMDCDACHQMHAAFETEHVLQADFTCENCHTIGDRS